MLGRMVAVMFVTRAMQLILAGGCVNVQDEGSGKKMAGSHGGVTSQALYRAIRSVLRFCLRYSLPVSYRSHSDLHIPILSKWRSLLVHPYLALRSPTSRSEQDLIPGTYPGSIVVAPANFTWLLRLGPVTHITAVLCKPLS